MTDTVYRCLQCDSTRGEPTNSGIGAWYWWRLSSGEQYGPFCSGKCMMARVSARTDEFESARAEWPGIIKPKKQSERGEE